MKVYTVEDLESFEKDEYGYLICPSGDYSQIKSFGECCSFGKDGAFDLDLVHFQDDEIEVIGNVYDNPELLNERSKK